MLTKQKTKKVPLKALETGSENKRQVESLTMQKSESIDALTKVMKELLDLKNLVKELKLSPDLTYPEPLHSVNQLFVEQEIDQTIQSDVMDKLLEKWSGHEKFYSEMNSRI